MSKPTPLSITVSMLVPATPAATYDLISDITAMSRYSPETVATEWLDGATEPLVGARFKGTNVIGKLRWSTKPTITAAERGSCFAFRVPGRSGPLWTYLFEPVEGGTLVTESMSQSVPSPLPIRILQRRAGVTDRDEHLRRGMIVTLDRLALAAASTTGVTH
ncbi:MAG: SRPBCC family protein [Nakamurella sp.]